MHMRYLPLVYYAEGLPMANMRGGLRRETEQTVAAYAVLYDVYFSFCPAYRDRFSIIKSKFDFVLARARGIGGELPEPKHYIKKVLVRL